MKKEILLAPIVRGSIMKFTNRPWTVAFCENCSEKGLEITIPNGSETEIANSIVTEMEKVSNSIPSILTISIDGEAVSFKTAPNCSELDKCTANFSWGKETYEACESRADVVKDRIALVTGGAQGFGEEIVRGLVKEGSTVFIADLNIDGAKALAQKLNDEKGKTIAFGVKVNVGDEESVIELFNEIIQTVGGIDLCVSNAGVLRASSILEQDMKSFQFVTDINYTAFATITKHCGLTVKRQHAANPEWTTDIIQINSKSGLEGSNKNGSYAGGKFGGIGLVQSFAMELVTYGIKVNAICPGNFFDGPLWSDPEKGLFVQYLNAGKVPGAKNIGDVKAFYEAKVPMNRGCYGIDVLRAIFYIVEQKYETGQAVPVTGGQVMLK